MEEIKIFHLLNTVINKVYLSLSNYNTINAKHSLSDIKELFGIKNFELINNFINFITDDNENVYYAKRNEYLFIDYITPNELIEKLINEYELQKKDNPYLKFDKFYNRSLLFLQVETIIKKVIYENIDNTRVFKLNKEVDKNIFIVYDYREDTTYYLCFSIDFLNDDFIEDYFISILDTLNNIDEIYNKKCLSNEINAAQKTAKETQNQYNHIFANNGYELFNYILENFIANKGQRGRYADVSFYYWKMYNNEHNYIHQRPEVFKNWFCETYSDSFEKIRTETDTTNRNRSSNFTTALNWFKQTD